MSENANQTFAVAPLPAESDETVRSLKSWVTPKVITSTMSDAGAAASPSQDGTAGTTGS